MTLRKFVYRHIYMHSPGWAMTKFLRKRGYCNRCGARKNLHLHHHDYRGYSVLAFVLPDLFSQMETLCQRHHAQEHE